tara:strand:- start:2378 stop:2776 length:399 start_codon:yes stop_codon:yes gene_type:complete
MHHSKGKLIYDDQCEFCLFSVRCLHKLDWLGKIEFIPLGVADQLMGSHSITLEDMQTQMHYISPDGHVSAGANAFRVFGKKIPLFFPLAMILHLPLLMKIAAFIYMKLALNRYVLSRFIKCSSKSCSIHRDP